MISRIALILLAGAIGGMLRGVLGIAKELVTKKDATVNWVWFWVSVVIAGILGVITATFFLDDLRIALIGGYAGSDFLDGLMKITLKNRFSPQKQQNIQPKKSGFGELIKKSV